MEKASTAEMEGEKVMQRLGNWQKVGGLRNNFLSIAHTTHATTALLESQLVKGRARTTV